MLNKPLKNYPSLIIIHSYRVHTYFMCLYFFKARNHRKENLESNIVRARRKSAKEKANVVLLSVSWIKKIVFLHDNSGLNCILPVDTCPGSYHTPRVVGRKCPHNLNSALWDSEISEPWRAK